MWWADLNCPGQHTVALLQAITISASKSYRNYSVKFKETSFCWKENKFEFRIMVFHIWGKVALKDAKILRFEKMNILLEFTHFVE